MIHTGICPCFAPAIATRGIAFRSIRLAALARARPRYFGPFGRNVGRISIPAPPSSFLPRTLPCRYATASEGSSKYTPSATGPPQIDQRQYSTPLGRHEPVDEDDLGDTGRPVASLE